jgi:hypothetical protein
MKYFESEHRVGADDCAMDAKTYQNASISDYSLWNNYNNNCNTEAEAKFNDFVLDNPNLRFKNGFGVTDRCHVDNDTEMRNNAKLTNDRAKVQLFTRFYQANPNLGKGVVIPTVESKLVQGDDTTQYKQCIRTTERDFDRFTPMIPCLAGSIQDPEHIVFPSIPCGESSRRMMRDSEFLKKCGYVYDGKAWRKASYPNKPNELKQAVQTNLSVPQNTQPAVPK